MKGFLMKIKQNCKRFLSLLLPSCLLVTGFSPAFATTAKAAEVKMADYFTSSDWIWSTEKVVKNNTSYFRKEFSLKGAPKVLEIKASGHNHLKYYVNGSLISGYVSPAPACIPENVNVLSYRLEGDALSKVMSGNVLCLAAAVQYMGNGATNYIDAFPAFWTEVTVTYADGSQEVLKTDTSWRALEDTPYGTTKMLFPRKGRKLGTQIDYDARKMPDGLAWTRTGYNEASYTAGTWHDAVPANAETANWKMRFQSIPEGTVHKGITPVAAEKQDVGYQVFDATQLVTGWVKIRASAPAGTRVYIRYSEYMNQDGTVHLGIGSTKQTSEEYRDFYTFSGNGVETFAADFDYRAFRYFEIVGLPNLIRPEDITVEWASTDLTQISEFSSSDPFLSQLYEACINTQLNNTIGMTVDCPHREQAHYLADSQLQYALLSYAFEEAPSVLHKTLLDFATSQLKNGRFTYTAPTEVYKSNSSIPEWDLRYSAILHRYYELTANLETTAEFYEVAARNVNYHMKFMKDGLLSDDPGSWNISDHPGKAVPDDPGAPPTVANLLLYNSMNRLSQIAALIGKSDESTDWAKKAQELKNTINTKLMSPASGSYYMHGGTTQTNAGVTAMAINVGVALPHYLDKQLTVLQRAQPDSTSVVLTYELLRALMEKGDAAQKEAAYQRMVTSWSAMVKKGHKTVWERFEDMSSHSHAWSGYPAYFMLSGFAGVTWNGGNAVVKPYLPKSVESLKGTVKQPGGEGSATVELKRDNGYHLLVSSPAEATVAVPHAEGGNSLILAGGTVVFRDGKGLIADGITYLKNDSEYVYFTVAANKTVEFQSTVADAQEGVFSLTVEATEGGKVQIAGKDVALPYSATVGAGETVKLVALADEGYAFVGWSGSLGSTNNSLNVEVKGETALVAVFEKREGKINASAKADEDLPQGDAPEVSTDGEPQLSGGANIPLILTLILIPALLIPCGIFFFKKRK